MKKRLLSAALALAMVLTMLPLSTLAAFAATTGTQVFYYAQGTAFQGTVSTEYAQSSGWYTREPVAGQSGKYTYNLVTFGVVSTKTNSNATWYQDLASAPANFSNYTLLQDITVNNLSWTLDVRLNGHNLTIGSLALTTGTNNARVGSYSITVTDDLVDDGNGGKTYNGSTGLTLGSALSNITGRSLTLKATNTKVDGNINVGTETDANGRVTDGTGSITLTGCDYSGNITLYRGSSGVAVSLSGTKVTGAIEVGDRAAGKGATVTLDHGSTASSVTMNGPSTLNIKDGSNAGVVTLDGGHKDATDVPANAGKDPKLWAAPSWSGTTVNMETSGSATSIKQDDACVIRHTIKVSSSAKAGDITLGTGNHVVTVSNASVDDVTLKTGSITLEKGASAGDITLGAADSTVAVSATVRDKTTAVNSITALNGKPDPVTVTISDGTVGNVKLHEDYAKGTITGGTFKTSIRQETGWLSKVTYELEKGSGSKTYTYTDSWDDAVNAFLDGNTVNVVGTDATVAVHFILDVNDDGTTPPPDMTVHGEEEALITLPDHIGGRKGIAIWYNGTEVNQAGKPFMIPPDVTEVYLYATSILSDVGIIDRAEVTADNGQYGLSASVEGGMIKLSGAVKLTSSQAKLHLKLTTTTGKVEEIDCVYYDNTSPKTILFVSGSNTSGNLVIQDGTKVALKNTGAFLTLDCTGLRKWENIDIAAGDEISDTGNKVTVNVAGIGTTVEKSNLENALMQSTFDYDASPAVAEAINKVIATYTENSIKTNITAGQRAYAQKTYGKADAATMELDDVQAFTGLRIEVYLEIRASNMSRVGNSSDGGSIDLDITPSYRLVVVGEYGGQPVTFPVPNTERALNTGSLTSSYGVNKVTVVVPTVNPKIFNTNTLYVHHKGYVYPTTVSNGQIEFNDLQGFSKFTVSAVAPVAEVDKVMRDGVAVEPTDIGLTQPMFYYDSLTDAVAEVADGGKIKVNEGYNGTTTIPVTGASRLFTVDNTANASKSLTFTGASVTAEKANSNNIYTVELKSGTTVTTAQINVNSASNGYATTSVTVAAQGSTVVITTVPNVGYTALTPTVTANNGGAVQVRAGTGGTYSFVVPAGATVVTVSPSFVLSGTTGGNNVASSVPFTDVSVNAWYYDGVAYCYNNFGTSGERLMGGFSNTNFGVNSTMTRAELVTVLWRMAGSPVETARTYFSDVQSGGSWDYTAAVNWAANHGYVTGYEDGTFRPNREISRQELAVILWRYADKPTYASGYSLANNFADGKGVASWAQSAMQWAAYSNILSGRNDASLYRYGTLDAYAYARRSELAVTIMKYHQYRYGA